MTTKRHIATFLTALVVFLVCTPMVSRMSCLKSGQAYTTIGQLSACCIGHGDKEYPVFEDHCCELDTVVMDSEMLHSEFGVLAWVIAGLPFIQANVDISIVHSFRLSDQWRGPPIDLLTFLAKVCVFRL